MTNPGQSPSGIVDASFVDIDLAFVDVTKSFRAGQRTVNGFQDLRVNVAVGKITGLIGNLVMLES